MSDGEQNYGQKTAIFGHIWQYLAIDGPSCPIWVEHRLNRVEHCISHMGGPVPPLWTHRKWSLGSQGASKNGANKKRPVSHIYILVGLKSQRRNCGLFVYNAQCFAEVKGIESLAESSILLFTKIDKDRQDGPCTVDLWALEMLPQIDSFKRDVCSDSR